MLHMCWSYLAPRFSLQHDRKLQVAKLKRKLQSVRQRKQAKERSPNVSRVGYRTNRHLFGTRTVSNGVTIHNTMMNGESRDHPTLVFLAVAVGLDLADIPDTFDVVFYTNSTFLQLLSTQRPPG